MKRWTEKDKEFLRKNNENMTAGEIGILIGRGEAGVRAKANELGLYKGTSIYHYNEDYFSKWSHEMASIFGFIVADGHINKGSSRGSDKLQINVAMKDEGFLDRIKCIMVKDGKIRYSNNEARINIGSCKMIGDLLHLGLCDNNKTINQRWIDCIPEKFISSFVLGLFNGDGCITYRKCSNNRLSVIMSICGTKIFVDKLRDEINKITGICGGVYRVSSIWDVRYHSKRAKKVLDWMYSGVSEGAVILDRKYDRYKLLDENGYYCYEEFRKVDY